MEDSRGGKGLGIAALILGILSVPLMFCGVGVIVALIAIILAIIAIAKKNDGKPLAIIGLVFSLITTIITAACIAIFLPYKDGMADLIQNMGEYIEEYDEDGTYPPVLEDMQENFSIPDEQMDAIMESIKQSYASSAAAQQ